MSRLPHSILAVFCLQVVFIPGLVAQESDTRPEAAVYSNQRPIEEIIVTASRSQFQAPQSLFQLKRQVEDKQDEVFAYFNANNSSDRMDIVCVRRATTGSYIKKRVCEPRFFRSQNSYRFQDWQLTTNLFPSQQDHYHESESDLWELQSEFRGLVSSNQEFADLVAEMADLIENYNDYRATLFSG